MLSHGWSLDLCSRTEPVSDEFGSERRQDGSRLLKRTLRVYNSLQVVHSQERTCAINVLQWWVHGYPIEPQSWVYIPSHDFDLEFESPSAMFTICLLIQPVLLQADSVSVTVWYSKFKARACRLKLAGAWAACSDLALPILRITEDEDFKSSIQTKKSVTFSYIVSTFESSNFILGVFPLWSVSKESFLDYESEASTWQVSCNAQTASE